MTLSLTGQSSCQDAYLDCFRLNVFSSEEEKKEVKRLGITIGDPAGIGPEICAKALAGWEGDNVAKAVLIGDQEILHRALERWGPELRNNPSSEHFELYHVDTPAARRVKPGQLDPASGTAMMAYVEKGIELTRSGYLSGLIGGPHNKEAVNKAGIPFSGYPNLIANRTGSDHAFIMLVGEKMKSLSVTLHVSLRNACDMLDTDLIIAALVAAHQTNKKLGAENPRIAVAGLNPHAGEGGTFGNEEEDLIIPALTRARDLGINVHGPFAGDTLFAPTHRGRFDTYIGMYHDQAHIAIKALEFENIVGLVVGTPLNFATVGHGSAYDIADRGIANPSSLIRTVRLISRMI